MMNFWCGRAKDSRVHLASDEQLVLKFCRRRCWDFDHGLRFLIELSSCILIEGTERVKNCGFEGSRSARYQITIRLADFPAPLTVVNQGLL